MTKILISPETCRAARALLNISQSDLAKTANLSKQTLVDFERGARTPYPNNLLALQSALENLGVEFIAADAKSGSGVRFLKP
ncbi:MAG: helix-turn-helix transcriptional regulator [Oceanicoccus sp.]|uniref:helix-turn-helix domain-containing protein n=1 Tax=Oceanicoccus sp. TaxID=2691044 RepID=UPI002607B0D7|nr:helix-turn-helix transcriptional regulator [Oceanicoccus sp.]MDG1772193.1 helix-turn-helix transcriptional regulator [Oceanicoccus sp.]